MRRTLDAIYVQDLTEALKTVEPKTPIIVRTGCDDDLGTLVGRSMLHLSGGNLFIFLDPERDIGLSQKPLFESEPGEQPPREPLLTPEEMAVIDKLAEAWNAFVQIPKQHPMHNEEFAHAIHAAQRIVMSRPVARHYGWQKILNPQDHG